MNMQKKNWAVILVWIIPVLFLLAFYFYPLSQVTWRSILQPGSLAEFDASNLRTAFRSIRFSFWQASLSTLVTAILGFPAAYLFGRFRFPGRNLLRILSTLPFILPTVVVAAAFNALIGTHGWLNILLIRLIY